MSPEEIAFSAFLKLLRPSASLRKEEKRKKDMEAEEESEISAADAIRFRFPHVVI